MAETPGCGAIHEENRPPLSLPALSHDWERGKSARIQRRRWPLPPVRVVGASVWFGQPLEFTADHLREPLQAPGRNSCDYILIDAIPVTACGWQVAGLPVVRESDHHYRKIRKTSPQSGLE